MKEASSKKGSEFKKTALRNADSVGVPRENTKEKSII